MREKPRKIDTIDGRFALVDTDGDRRYPYKKEQEATGRYGYAIGRDRGGGGAYLQSIEEVIKAVVLGGETVRTTTIPPTASKGSNGVALSGKVIVGYEIDDSLAYLVTGARVPPLGPTEPETLSNVFGVTAALAELAADPKTKDLSETVRRALANARVGQGRFRKSMLRLWGGCCALSGCAIDKILVASHALPWAESTNDQRLDPYNGLLLAASLDRLFDAGLISISDEGAVLKSDQVDWQTLEAHGLPRSRRLRVVPHRRHLPYLAAHRRRFGYSQVSA